MRADNLTDPIGGARLAAEGPALNIESLLAHGQALLVGRGDAPRLQAELLLARVLARPRSYLRAHPSSPVAAALAAAYQALLERAVAGEPTAYLIGEREFWSLSLQVSPAVLIPRPETELAVERCLALIGASGARGVCDLGTGSGAIALALALERPDWRITATDCSAAALELAQINAARLGAHHIEFLRGDWFAPLARRHFDLIVSNPPYVAAADPALQPLRHEPRAALTPGATGFEALGQIVLQAPEHLKPGGWLVLEHGASQALELAQALLERGYARVTPRRDLAGRDRVTEAQWT